MLLGAQVVARARRKAVRQGTKERVLCSESRSAGSLSADACPVLYVISAPDPGTCQSCLACHDVPVAAAEACTAYLIFGQPAVFMLAATAAVQAIDESVQRKS